MPRGFVRDSISRVCALLFFLSLFAVAWSQPQVKIGDVTWYTDYDQALEIARKENKPLWLHFGENPG